MTNLTYKLSLKRNHTYLLDMKSLQIDEKRRIIDVG